MKKKRLELLQRNLWKKNIRDCKALFTLGNSQATQRKLGYRQFVLPLSRIPTGDLVPHPENTVKGFGLSQAVVNPRSTLLALFINTWFPQGQETHKHLNWRTTFLASCVRLVKYASLENRSVCVFPTTQHWKWILRYSQDTRVSVMSPGNCLVWRGPKYDCFKTFQTFVNENVLTFEND